MISDTRNWILYLKLLVVGHLLSCVRSAPFSPSSSSSSSSTSVSSTFTSMKSLNCLELSTRQNWTSFSSFPVNGKDLGLCPSSTSCCTSKSEENFLESAKNEIQVMLKQATDPLQRLLINNLQTFKDNFTTALHLEMRSTQETVKEFGSPKLASETEALFEAIHKFFNHSSPPPSSPSTPSGSSTTIDHHLANQIRLYFNHLFPLFYVNRLIDSRGIATNRSQLIDCIKTNQNHMKPLLDSTSDQLEESLLETLRDLKLLLESLSLGLDVIHETRNYQVSTKCLNAFVKLNYCKYCTGLENATPCVGYCLNIGRSCVAPLAELDLHWIHFVSAFKYLINSFTIRNSIDMLNAFVYKWMFKVFDTVDEINGRIRTLCEPHFQKTMTLKKDFSGLTLMTSSGRSNKNKVNYSQLLLKQLHNLVQKLLESADFFATIGDVGCIYQNQKSGFNGKDKSDHGNSENKVQNCWNGTQLGSYSSPIIGIGFDAQRSNPEIKENYSETDPRIMAIIGLKERLDEKSKSMLRNTKHQDEGSNLDLSPISLDDDHDEDGINSRHNINDKFPADDEEGEENGSGSGDYTDYSGGGGLDEYDTHDYDSREYPFSTSDDLPTEKPNNNDIFTESDGKPESTNSDKVNRKIQIPDSSNALRWTPTGVWTQLLITFTKIIILFFSTSIFL